MKTKKDLMTRLDEASMQLLDRYFNTEQGKPQPKASEQIKAFDAVVKYFGPRTKQSDEVKDSPFDSLRSNLTNRTPARRPGAGKAASNGHDSAGDDSSAT